MYEHNPLDGPDNRWEDITEILPGVYLGDCTNGEEFKQRFNGVPICVHENKDSFSGDGPWIPIMVGHRSNFFTASKLMLDAATSAMRHYQRSGIPVLIHCHGGVERSPLTMAWFLKRYGYEKSLPAAYEYIKARRGIVQDRLHWLSHDSPNKVKQ